MKNFIVFILGLISGGVLTIGLIMILAIGANESDKGMTMLEQPGECMSTNSFSVTQVIDENAALARETDLFSDLLVLLVNDEGILYYDDQIINIPEGKCARQVGVYKYTTHSGIEKTVPIVKIME
jgi:hypothetical protein